MNITFDDKIKEFMNQKNYNNIALEVSVCNTWAGTVKDLSARFVENNEASEFTSKGYKNISVDGINIYYKPTQVILSDIITFTLKTRLWMHNIVFKGIAAV